jgi:4'-phosphopantetheinyl transferase EntD
MLLMCVQLQVLEWQQHSHVSRRRPEYLHGELLARQLLFQLRLGFL